MVLKIDNGLQKMGDDLRSLAPQLVGPPKNPLRNAARAMGNDVMEEAQRRVPVSDGPDGGRLQRAIEMKLISTRYRDMAILNGNSKEYYYIGVNEGDSRKDENGAYYHHFVEFGTEKQPAQPYLRPAVEGREDKLGSTFVDKFGRDLETMRKKVERLSASRRFSGGGNRVDI